MNLNDLMPAVTIIVMIGIVLGLGLYAMAEVRENIATEYTGTDTDTNMSGTSNNNQTTLSDATKDDYKLVDITSIIAFNNTQSNTLTETTDYTFTSAGVVTFEDNIASNYSLQTNITSTYIYDKANSPESATNDTLEGLADFAGWIAVIVVVLAAAIVLGVVMRSFGRQSARV